MYVCWNHEEIYLRWSLVVMAAKLAIIHTSKLSKLLMQKPCPSSLVCSSCSSKYVASVWFEMRDAPFLSDQLCHEKLWGVMWLHSLRCCILTEYDTEEKIVHENWWSSSFAACDGTLCTNWPNRGELSPPSKPDAAFFAFRLLFLERWRGVPFQPCWLPWLIGECTFLLLLVLIW